MHGGGYKRRSELRDWTCLIVRWCVHQARGSIEDTKKRVAESERRIDEKLPQFVNKKYW